jgi:hypothetical protein
MMLSSAMTSTIRWLALVVVACGGDPGPAPLERTIEVLSIGSWRLDEPTWRRLVVEPYRDLFPEYDRVFDDEMVRLGRQIAKHKHQQATPMRIETRKHFAGDPLLTTGEAWTRWALPVLADSSVATIDGVPLDAVFIHDGARWRVIAGLDKVVRARVSALDASCAPLMEAPAKQCRDIAWQIADAALRNQRSRFTRACALAASHCGKPAP